MVITYGQLYLAAREELLKTENDEIASFMAREVLCQAAGFRPDAFLLNRDNPVPESILTQVKNDVKRLMTGEPLAYVLGEWEFYGLPLYVTPDVLIPRDDTCAVAELAIKQGLFLNQDPRILDLCCGSGCIGLAVADRVKDARVTLADLSRDALNIAKKNIQRNKMGGRVSCYRLDAKETAPAFLGKFDMIVSNPPYITAADMKTLPESVKAFEPYMALFGGEDGLDFYRAIVKNFTDALKPGGFLCLEFGMGQGDDVCRILEDNGYTVLKRTKDFNDRERAVLAEYGRKEY